MARKAVGIIVEYNPFHNGHLYHIKKAKEISQAEVVVAVMSGHFLQRGEPALVNKWTRARMAIEGGADLVIELPYAFATQKAEVFAHGAVSILQALDVHSLCFGSEIGQIRAFYELVDFVNTNEKRINEAIKKQMKKGVSYPQAASIAFQQYKREDFLDVSQPNNILGFHYVKAIREQQAGIEALTIKRLHANYHEQSLVHPSIASATSIRNEIDMHQSLERVEHYMPNTSAQLIRSDLATYGKLLTWEDLFPYLQYRLLTTSSDELQSIYEIEEGIEHRLKKYSKQAISFQDFMTKVKTKRYTWTRLQRMCTHIITNTSKVDLMPVLETKKVPYLRLLAMSETGQAYLNRIKKHLPLPLVSKRSSYNHPLLLLDEQATHTYAMAFDATIRMNIIKKEYATPPIKLK